MHFQVGDEVFVINKWHVVLDVRPSVSRPGSLSPRIQNPFKEKEEYWVSPRVIVKVKPGKLENV